MPPEAVETMPNGCIRRLRAVMKTVRRRKRSRNSGAMSGQSNEQITACQNVESNCAGVLGWTDLVRVNSQSKVQRKRTAFHIVSAL